MPRFSTSGNAGPCNYPAEGRGVAEDHLHSAETVRSNGQEKKSHGPQDDLYHSGTMATNNQT